jgi:uncharacterized membrane protein YciS (DUF1049 family)
LKKFILLTAITSRGSVQQVSSAAGGTLGLFQLGLATDKRYSLGLIMRLSVKIIIQLLREFLIPLVLSIAWVILNFLQSNGQWTLLTAINVFGPTFFLLSWMIGQIFRVKKQIGVETTLQRITGDLENVANTIRVNAEKLSSSVTGGDGFIHFLPQVYYPELVKNGLVLLMLKNGEYPLYDVSAKLISSLDLGYPDMELVVGNTKEKVSSLHKLPIDMIGVNEHKLKLWITARNGAYYQDIWLKKTQNRWTFAIRVRDSNNGIRLEQVDTDFPIHGDKVFEHFDTFPP